MSATRRKQPASTATTDSLGFLLAKASSAWNDALAARLQERGFGDVRPSYGSVLLPLYEQDELRMGALGHRSRLSKQTLTTLVRAMERDGLVERAADPDDARATRIRLTPRAHALRPVADEVLRDLDARVAEHLSRQGTEALRRALRGVIDL
jgi:DNA-binding MarR family transcriptional regulator